MEIKQPHDGSSNFSFSKLRERGEGVIGGRSLLSTLEHVGLHLSAEQAGTCICSCTGSTKNKLIPAINATASGLPSSSTICDTTPTPAGRTAER